MSPIATTNFQPPMSRELGEVPAVQHRIPAPEAFSQIRRHALRLARFGNLPHADAEDLAAELVARELTEAKSVAGRPAAVTDTRWTVVAGKHRSTGRDICAWLARAEREAPTESAALMIREGRTRAAWVKLEAKDYRRRVLARRLEEATDTGDLPELEAEDITEAEAEAPAPMSPAGALIEGRRLAARLELPADCADALAQGVWTGTTATLAAAAGVAPATWHNRTSRAAKLIRETYPDPTDLAEQIERGIVRRRTPLAERRIGAPLPADGHRTAAQSAREADVLLARPQRPGRAPTAASLSPDERTMSAAHCGPVTARHADYLLPAALLRDIGRMIESRHLPRSGPRPHRATHDISPDLSGITHHADPDMSRSGYGLMTRDERTLQDRDHREGWSNPTAPAARRRLTSARRWNGAQYRRDIAAAEHEREALVKLIDRVNGRTI